MKTDTPPEKPAVIIYWMRRDLRFNDNNTLKAAAAASRRLRIPLLPLFIFDPEILDPLTPDDHRVAYIYTRLKLLNDLLSVQGSSLQIENLEPREVFHTLSGKYRIHGVYAGEDYEPYARSRDKALTDLLTDFPGAPALHLCRDQVIYAGDEVVKQDGSPYTVFTPYSRTWLKKFSYDFGGEDSISSEEILSLLAGKNNDPLLNAVDWFPGIRHFPDLEELGFRESVKKAPDLRLDHIASYAQNRDFPALEGSSSAGVHLRFGAVSIRQLVSYAKKTSASFLNELIWREFFQQILSHYPESSTQNFRRVYDALQWRNDEEGLTRWKEGRTGFPFIDAGMRELEKTGMMHNRVRMAAAGFLCKDLLIDWRIGEAYFASQLFDYEMASNVGNWQWAAGTGCDAAPYFRVFNPFSQQKKFDSSFTYIRRWIPEFGTPDYPEPMLDHAAARIRALEVYKASRS